MVVRDIGRGFFLPPHDVIQEPVQGTGVSRERSPAPRVPTNKLGHHRHMEGIPLTDKFVFRSKPNLAVPKAWQSSPRHTYRTSPRFRRGRCSIS